MSSTSPRISRRFASPHNHIGRMALRGVLATAAAAGLIASLSTYAAAAPGASATDTTTANVGVTSAITLTGLTSAFTLSGLPGATVTGLGAVTMNVESNGLAGYTVTVQAQTPTLVATDLTNVDSIPIEALTVRETGDTLYLPMSDAAAVTVHEQAGRSAEEGDTISNDYEVAIPFVSEDTYTTTLDYVTTVS